MWFHMVAKLPCSWCWELSLFRKTAICLSLFTEIICKHFSQFFTARKSILSRTAISLLYEFVQTRNKRVKFISEIRQSPCCSSMWTFMFHLSTWYVKFSIWFSLILQLAILANSQSWLLVIELNLVMGSTICLDIRRDF